MFWLSTGVHFLVVVLVLEIADIHRERGKEQAKHGKESDGHPEVKGERGNDHCRYAREKAEISEDSSEDLCSSKEQF